MGIKIGKILDFGPMGSVQRDARSQRNAGDQQNTVRVLSRNFSAICGEVENFECQGRNPWPRRGKNWHPAEIANPCFAYHISKTPKCRARAGRNNIQ